MLQTIGFIVKNRFYHHNYEHHSKNIENNISDKEYLIKEIDIKSDSYKDEN